MGADQWQAERMVTCCAGEEEGPHPRREADQVGQGPGQVRILDRAFWLRGDQCPSAG